MVNVMKHNKTIELLAPAGSWEALEAAVNAQRRTDPGCVFCAHAPGKAVYNGKYFG